MKISQLQLVNFKRFTDLKISNIPADSKLVLLIGSNGSGKSSIFDAFDYLKKPWKGHPNDYQSYYGKNNLLPSVSVLFADGKKQAVENTSIIAGSDAIAKKFIGRSSVYCTKNIQ